MSVFARVFICNHFKQSWLLYLFLLIFVCLYIFSEDIALYVHVLSSCDLKEFEDNPVRGFGTGLVRFIEGISLSYVAAYIFYMVLNLYSSFIKEKNAIRAVETWLGYITNDIVIIVAIMRCFMRNIPSDVCIPSNIVYFKNGDDEGRDFFNPREEIEAHIRSITQNVDRIKTKTYSNLSAELCLNLVKLDTAINDLHQWLYFRYNCIDSGCLDVQIGSRDPCFSLQDMEDAGRVIVKYIGKKLLCRKYVILTENEEAEYKAFIEQNRLSVNYHGDRVYLGSNRIK